MRQNGLQTLVTAWKNEYYHANIRDVMHTSRTIMYFVPVDNSTNNISLMTGVSTQI